ncbi:MAG: GNAT family N-acetyltransferase [Acidobacteria bacterium]|nr:GNAT family N-acetyltransferase [Acidobacteriota bacterium]
MPGPRLADVDPDVNLPMIEAWLHRPHVARWLGDPEQALAAVRRHPPSTQALILINDRPVGFVCWQTLTPGELEAAGLTDLPGDLVDVDIVIGEADALGHGIGPAALNQLFGRLRAEAVLVVGVADAVENRRALRAYEKVGFRTFRDFVEAGQRMRYLTLTLDQVPASGR